MKETLTALTIILVCTFVEVKITSIVYKDALVSYDNIQKIIKECESTIPRNQHCEIVIDTKVVKDE